MDVPRAMAKMATFSTRLYAVRLDRLRALEECHSLLSSFDYQGLLTNALAALAASPETMG